MPVPNGPTTGATSPSVVGPPQVSIPSASLDVHAILVEVVSEKTGYPAEVLEPGMRLVGPAVIQEPAVTLVVPPGERVSVDEYGNYHVELGSA